MAGRRVVGGTEGAGYTRYLLHGDGHGWRRFVDVQWPYRTHLKSLSLGATLDYGCGVGRCLRYLSQGSVGIDHNATSVAACREQGLEAYLPADFRPREGERFDSILLAHVAEHMRRGEVLAVLSAYLPLLRPGGRLVLITPQEKGFAVDPTHVEFMDFAALKGVEQVLGLCHLRQYSFPFPRLVGRVFPYNEFVSISVKP